jgi:hypothetical protein
MTKDILFHFMEAFLKLAARPGQGFDPRSEDFQDDARVRNRDQYSPEDDDYDPANEKYDDPMQTEPGSNYSYLTEPLPGHKEDERVEFARHLLIIQKHYKDALFDVQERLDYIRADQSSFVANTKTGLRDIVGILSRLYNGDSTNLSQDVVSKIRTATRDAMYIKHALSSFTEVHREYGVQNAISQLSRISDQLVIIGKNILKALNAATSKSYKKRQSRESWDFGD